VADVVSAAVRSRMMAGIKGKNTNPELLLRKGLHARGFRFRLHDRSLPGTPDIILPRYRAVIFAHGCFWHGHDCHLFKWPRTREEFWRAKIARNQELDAKAEATLAKTDWRHAVIWECALKGRARLPIGEVLASCAEWIRSEVPRLEIRGS
jgi:DNA mismatch endonuclease, patch repair protein